MTNILITGSTGFIGSHLAQHLSENKNNVIYGLTHSIKHESVFNALHLDDKENINLIYGDVTNSVTIERCLYQYDIDQIYHLAAQAIVRDAAECPVSTIQTNVIGTLNILENVRKFRYIKDKEIPTLINSTDKSYGITDRLPYTEDYPLNGQDIYSASKACSDILSRSYYYNYNLPIVVSRPSNVFGLDFNWSRILPSLAKSCLLKSEKDNPIILNKGSYNFIRDYTYTEDVVKALELLIKNIDKTKGNAYNVSSNLKYTTKEIVEIFLELSDHKDKQIQFREKEITFKEIPEQYLDSSKLIKTTDWKPKYNLEDGLRETIKKYNKWFNNESWNSSHEADTELCRQKF